MVIAWVIPLTIFVVVCIIVATCLREKRSGKVTKDIENCKPPKYSDVVENDPPSYIEIVRENQQTKSFTVIV